MLLVCCRHLLPRFLPTENTDLTLVGFFFLAGSVCALMGPELFPLVLETSGLWVYLCCAFMGGVWNAGCGRSKLLWCCCGSDFSLSRKLVLNLFFTPPEDPTLKHVPQLCKHLDEIKPRATGLQTAPEPGVVFRGLFFLLFSYRWRGRSQELGLGGARAAPAVATAGRCGSANRSRCGGERPTGGAFPWRSARLNCTWRVLQAK